MTGTQSIAKLEGVEAFSAYAVLTIRYIYLYNNLASIYLTNKYKQELVYHELKLVVITAELSRNLTNSNMINIIHIIQLCFTTSLCFTIRPSFAIEIPAEQLKR
ncbi:unnamed protein product [Ilex paraguariensis]|uniref:Uncharacterized protein n=1 Tax=Ilex paraguariensis TaxID=185542 RepID=A0ABC8UVU2_9AQUA